MKETVLKSLMRLYAIVSQVHSIDEKEIARRVVEDYLKHVIRSDKIRQFLIMYDFYHSSLREREIKTGEKQLALLSVKSVIICEQINQWLDRKQRLFVLAHILEMLSLTKHQASDEIDFVRTIALALKIEEVFFDDCRAFIFDKLSEIRYKENVLIVNRNSSSEQYRYLFRDIYYGEIFFYYFDDADFCLFRITGENIQIYLNDIQVIDNRVHIFEAGSVLKNPLMGTLFYTDVIKVFLHENTDKKVVFCVENLSYHFPDSNPAIEPISFTCEAGQLIGIMGASGVGKSTLIDLLNGNFTPSTGRVLLNGYDIHNEKKLVEGLIGFIPQDDVLINELTVFQNLYLNASLCFKDLSEESIVRKTGRLLYTLGLYEIKDLKVGSILDKQVSGGQRKRLNIALELMREPQVLFVDEPTSGLSSTDSDMVIDLLKKQCYKDKLVFLNIHQPSSKTFKKLDKLIILDKGGRVAFFGNPIDSILYVKSYSQLVNSEEGECPVCGNLEPDQILNILEAKKVNDSGDYTTERQISPNEWYSNFEKNREKDFSQACELKIDLPPKHFQPPSKYKQFKIFSLRNILTRFANKQYLVINFLEAPVLAIILGWFTRYNAGTESNPLEYVFSKNINLPVYIFMSVIVALFLGLMVSAEEIIRDRKLIKRETFLHLSRRAYYNSKVVYLAGILAIQIFLYVLIGNAFLEIKGMLFKYWLLLWTTAFVAGLLGLNLSSTLRTVVAIYISIPLVLIPQILLGGAIIKFDKLNSRITNREYVPVVGDIMPSRWAYEGLIINQFTQNKYEKQLFYENRAVSNASYMLNYYIPELIDLLSGIKRSISTNNIPEYIIKQKVTLLLSEIGYLKNQLPACNQYLTNIRNNIFNIATASAIEQYLNCCRDYYINYLNNLIVTRDKKLEKLEKDYGGRSNLIDFKNKYYNENLADIVLNKNEAVKIETKQNFIIRKVDPVYQVPEMKFGRSHFLSAEKRLGIFYIETYWFNLIILFVIALCSYYMLLFEVLVKIHSRFNRKSISLFYKTIKKELMAVLQPLMRK